jgi:hypothetical protein
MLMGKSSRTGSIEIDTVQMAGVDQSRDDLDGRSVWEAVKNSSKNSDMIKIGTMSAVAHLCGRQPRAVTSRSVRQGPPVVSAVVWRLKEGANVLLGMSRPTTRTRLCVR